MSGKVGLFSLSWLHSALDTVLQWWWIMWFLSLKITRKHHTFGAMQDSGLITQRSQCLAFWPKRALCDPTDSQGTAKFSKILKRKPRIFYLLLNLEAISGFQALSACREPSPKTPYPGYMCSDACSCAWWVEGPPREPWVRAPTVCPCQWGMHLPNLHHSFHPSRWGSFAKAWKLNYVSNCSHAHSFFQRPSQASGWRF